MISGGALNGSLDLFYGGVHWQSAAYAIWESFVSVSMCIGLIALFKEKINRQSGFIKVLSDNAFSVYVFHAPIIVTISYIFEPVSLFPLLKFILTAILSIPICFIVTNFTVRKIALLKKKFA